MPRILAELGEAVDHRKVTGTRYPAVQMAASGFSCIVRKPSW